MRVHSRVAYCRSPSSSLWASAGYVSPGNDGQTELEPIIRNALEACRPAIDQAHHTLSVDLPDKPVHIIADAVRLTQVFCNPLNNSSKYTLPGGCLELSAACQDTSIIVPIKDNGIGIEPGMMPHVFDMLARPVHASTFSRRPRHWPCIGARSD